MKCRVCSSGGVKSLGIYKAYSDYQCEVFECGDCGSRFVLRDESIYERLHASPHSSYSRHDEIAGEAKRLFDEHDTGGLRELLRTNFSSFAIDTIDSSGAHKVMEVGCSKGYFTAYLAATGCDAIGTDISESAIASARERFGDYFALPDSPRAIQNVPYDAIIHIGTIGCVESPGEFTRNLLSMLKPGGILVFNSPNVESCRELGEIWIRGTSPPDLVTLFQKKYWLNHFNDLADVSVAAQKVRPLEAGLLYLSQRKGPSVIGHPDTPLFEQRRGAVTWQGRKPVLIKSLARGIVTVGVKLGQALRLIPEYSAQYGLQVVMVRKPDQSDN